MRGQNQVNKSLNTFHRVLAVWPPSAPATLRRRCKNTITTPSLPLELWRRLSRGAYQTRPFGLQMKRWQQILLFSYDIIALSLFVQCWWWLPVTWHHTGRTRAGCEPTLIRPLNLNGRRFLICPLFHSLQFRLDLFNCWPQFRVEFIQLILIKCGN